MFDQSLATVIAAVVAVAGTIVSIVIAQRRWTRERREARFGKFEADQQDIYKELWDKIEEVNVALRRERVDESGFGKLVADLKAEALRKR